MKKFTFIFLLLFCIRIELFAFEREENFSLVISGGISLGAYEAGYNWALLKYMTYLKYHNPNLHIHLKSIAGASAGAINTLISAMSWCRSKDELDTNNTIEDNLFYHMWTAVDFEDLLIDQNRLKDSENKTSLFSRKKIQSQADKIIQQLHRPLYDRSCRVPFGFAVTMVKPKEVEINGISMENKLFQIPLYLSVDVAGRGIIRDNYTIKKNNIIHLSGNANKIVSDASVKKAMFASSAFPIAFEQVKLDYYYNGNKESRRFLDGGVFDNIPLDLAIRLSHNQSSDYIFMDPKNNRNKYVSLTKRETQISNTSPINSAIELLMDIFSSSESSLLYNTLSEHFGDEQKKIHLSNRYFPLTGMMLGHFGAFLDFGFREYDYYIGVYDAIVNSAKYSCKGKDLSCFDRTRKNIYKILTKDSKRAKGFLNFLSKEEFSKGFEDTNIAVDDELKIIYKSIKNLTIEDMQDFHQFLKNLNQNHYKAKNAYLKHALVYPDEWYRKTLSSIVQRVVSLEQLNSTNISKTIASVGAYTTGSFYRHKNSYVYNPVSAPLDQDKLWVKALPYEMAVGRNMISFGYENYFYFDTKKAYLPKAVELKPSLSLELYDKRNQVSFIRVDLNLNFEPKKDILSVGVGPSFYRDIDNSISNKIDTGINAYVDLLNIVRITATRRNNYKGYNWYVYVGINDIPSFIYWLFVK